MAAGQAPVVEGELVAGKYRMGRVLGSGGMGVVVEATHVQLEQRVALKFLRDVALEHAEVVERFTREARAAARIQSVHVARVLDVGELPSGAPYMVMEHLQGEDLEQTLARRGALPVVEAVDYFLQACEAVAEAHALGIIHRDLKPANLFLADHPGGRPLVKVLDFGISKVQSDANNPRLTKTSSMFGSPPYMSPEQVRATHSADARSDIWSLGAVLYELVTQRQPFPAETAPALFVAILHEEPQRPSLHRADLPPLLETAIMRCLEKDPRLRFQDVAMLASGIGPFGPANAVDSVARISHVLGASRIAVGFAATVPQKGPAAKPGLTAGLPLPTLPSRVTQEQAAQTAPGVAPGLESPPALAPAPGPSKPTPLSTAQPAAAGPRGKRGVAVLAAGTVLAAGIAIAVLVVRATPAARPSAAPAIVAAPPATTAPVAAPPAAPPATSPPPHPGAPLTATPPLAAGTSGPTRRAAHHVPERGATPELAAPRVNPPEHVSPTGPLRNGAGAPAAVCAKLLERQSLGESLTSAEAAVYARECNRK